MTFSQWPSSGRVVHVDVAGFRCVPAIVLDTPDPMDQPVERIRVQVFPVNEFPHPMYFDNGDGHDVWHWPEFVGPDVEGWRVGQVEPLPPSNPSLMGSTSGPNK